ncbi:MAG: hypothetical protein ACRD1L_01980 [Terriglobales bacterium]
MVLDRDGVIRLSESGNNVGGGASTEGDPEGAIKKALGKPPAPNN